MSEDRKYMLVRSPLAPESGFLGIGWRKIPLADFKTWDELEEKLAIENVGRSRNQLRRFYSLEEGDIVVLPVYRAIVLGKVVDGSCSYDGSLKEFANNQIAVDFLKDDNGHIIRFPRRDLTNSLESRLRIRLTVADLGIFSDEIEELYARRKSIEPLAEYLSLLEQHENTLKKQLISNIRSGNNNRLEAGGYGLEKLIKELLECEGYEHVDIQAKKNSTPGDTDIIATKRGDRFDPQPTDLVIQVKHHNGFTSDYAVQQLDDLPRASDDARTIKWVITSGNVSEAVVDDAQAIGVQVMDREGLAEWIVEHLASLSDETRARLAVANAGVLLG